jgi:hypothetical protein
MSKTYKDKLEPNLAEMSSGVQREVVGNIPIIVEFRLVFPVSSCKDVS